MIPFACTAAALPPFGFAPLQDRPAIDTILVVEDEAAVCELAAEALLDEGFRVLTAADADAAEAILSRERVDLLFTDIDLARNTNGIALARRARRSLPRLPVVYTSGGREGLSPSEAVAESVFVAKPYRTAQLLAVTHDLLRARG